MTDVLRPEIASSFGCLDSGAIIDGDASHASALRELARSTNRLIEQSSPVINVMFDASTDGSETTVGSCVGYGAFYSWQPLIRGPLICPKKPNHRYLDGRIIANIPTDEQFFLQVTTSDRPFDQFAKESDDNVFRLQGTGTWEAYTLEGVPVSDSELTTIGLFAVNDTGTSTASSVTYGSPTSAYSGAFSFGGVFPQLNVPAAAWNTTGSTLADDGKFAVVIKSFTDSDLVSPPHRIIAVVNATTLQCSVTRGQHRLRGGHRIANTATATNWKFDIVELSRFRIANIAFYSRGSRL